MVLSATFHDFPITLLNAGLHLFSLSTPYAYLACVDARRVVLSLFQPRIFDASLLVLPASPPPPKKLGHLVLEFQAFQPGRSLGALPFSPIFPAGFLCTFFRSTLSRTQRNLHRT